MAFDTTTVSVAKSGIVVLGTSGGEEGVCNLVSTVPSKAPVGVEAGLASIGEERAGVQSLFATETAFDPTTVSSVEFGNAVA